MSTFVKMVDAISGRYNGLINKYCRDLFDFLDLNEFYYFKISNDGFYMTFDSHISWLEYLAENQLYLSYPLLCNPKLIQEGIVIYKDVQEKSLVPIFNPKKEKFNVGLTLQLNHKSLDGVEVFGFSSSCANGDRIASLLNELPILRLFAEKFKSDNKAFFTKMESNQIYLPDLMGHGIYERGPLRFPDGKKEAFLQKMGIENPLTKRETTIIKLVLRGYSAGKIALQILLSRRTVEHHVERIKQKLGCDSKSELIQKARELEVFGYLRGPELRNTSDSKAIRAKLQKID